MTRTLYDMNLRDLKLKLLKMASFTQDSIESAFDALFNKDINSAKQIIKNDVVANEMKVELEHECFKLIAREQPLAKDLRNITVILMIAIDIERIADHAADISEITVSLADYEYKKFTNNIVVMRKKAKEMLVDAINAFAYNDVEVARKVCKSDDELDDLFKDCVREYEELVKENVNDISMIGKFMFISKYLERIGDHATNVAEWAIYSETGMYERDH